MTAFKVVLSSEEKRHLLPKNNSPRSSRTYHIEFYFILSSVGLILIETVLPNFLELVYCRFAWDVSEERCFDPTSTYFEESQKFASTFLLVHTCINVAFSLILFLFIGPWSDIHGRKLLIIIPTIGFAITGTLMILASIDRRVNPLVVLLYFIPSLVTGGKFTQLFAGFCSVCDLSSDEKRSFSLGMFQAAIYAGAVLANFLGVFIVSYGYTVVFSVTTVFVLLSLLQFSLFHKETVACNQDGKLSETGPPASRSLFQLSYVREIHASYRKHNSKDRLILVLNMLTRLIFTLCNTGEEKIMYFFLQWKLGISLQEFAQYLIFDTIALAIAAMVGSWLLRDRFSDTCVLMTVTACQLIHTLPIIFGNSMSWIYLAAIFRAIGGLFISRHKSALSKLVGKDDTGKMLAVSDFGDALGGIILGSIVYTDLYQVTLLSFPEASFVLSLILDALVLVIFGYIMVIDKSSSNEAGAFVA